MSEKNYTETQGQYLSFIYLYTKISGQPPAEKDIQRYFKVTAPSVHSMILTLERRGLITRVPRQARTIKVTIPEEKLPNLK